MKKSSKIILAGVLAISVAGGVFAFGSHHHFSTMSKHEKADMIKHRIGYKLDLTSQQEVHLEALTGRVVELMQQASDHRQVQGYLLNDMVSGQPLDQVALLESTKHKTVFVNEQAPEIVALLAGFVDSLDVQQKQQIKQLIEQRRGHH